MKGYGKKIWALALALTLSASVLMSGCSPKVAADAKAADGTDATSKEPIELTMWDDMASEESARVIVPIIDKWNADHPDIQIKREAVDVESYKIKLKTAISANEAPDLFFSWGSGFSQPFIDAEKILPLDEYLSDEIKADILPGSLTNCMYDGKTYGLPYNMWYAVFYCNTELFDKYGIKIPETYAELLTAVKEFRANDVGPIGVGVNERWTAMFYHNMLALRTAGAKACQDALEGKASFDTPEMLEAAAKLKELVDAGAFIDGGMGLNYDEFMASFKQGEIPMILQGTWAAGEMEMDEYPVKGKIVAKKFPVIEGAKGDAKEYLGGSIDVYMVNAETEHKAEAVQALEYICREMSREGFLQGIGLPVYKADYDKTKIDRLTLEAAALVEDSTGFVLAWDTFLVGEDAQVHLDLVGDIFAGVKTPEEFVKQMQTVNEN